MHESWLLLLWRQDQAYRHEYIDLHGDYARHIIVSYSEEGFFVKGHEKPSCDDPIGGVDALSGDASSEVSHRTFDLEGFVEERIVREVLDRYWWWVHYQMKQDRKEKGSEMRS